VRAGDPRPRCPYAGGAGHGSAIWGASVGLGITAGVLLAASLDIGTGWRETYVVVGVLALALVVPSLRLPESAAEHPRRLDLPGVVTLGAAMTLLVSGLTQARSGLTAGVVRRVRRRDWCCWPFRGRRVALGRADAGAGAAAQPRFLAATIGTLVLGGGIISMSSNVPTLVQVDLGDSLWVASWLLLTWSVTSVVTSLVVRNLRIPLSGPRLIALALGVVVARRAARLGMTADSSPWRLAPSMFVAGLATGVLNAVLARESVANVPADRAAMGSGSNNTARYLGAACGITVFSVLLTHAGWDAARPGRRGGDRVRRGSGGAARTDKKSGLTVC
jgi:predicted MFS family arabinose efflux permease